MMEASELGGREATPEEIAAKEAAAREAEAAESGNASGVAGSDVPDAPVEEGEGESDESAADSSDEQPAEDDRTPARDQAPVATDAQEAIIGDQGTRDEQQPQQEAGSPSNVDTPNRTSAPPPEAQSGVPLPEDRAAGVQPGGEGQE